MRKMLILVLGLSIGGYAAFRSQTDDVTTTHDTRLVRDRVWIDHLPRNEREKVNVFVALTKGPGPRRGPIGLFESVSAWEGQFEAFRHEMHGDEMRVVFPQRGDKETLRVTARTCSEAGMDYCLDVAGSSRGVKRYYSRKGWEIDRLGEVGTITHSLAAD